MPKSQSNRPRRRWIIAAVLSLLIVSILAGLPELMRWGAIRALRDLGLSATIENVDFNPFTGRLAVYGLWAQSGPAPVLSADRVELELQWRALLERRLQINDLRLDGTYVLVEQSAGGEFRAAGIAPPAPAPADPAVAEPAADAAWTLRLNRLLWTGGRLEAVLAQGRHALRVDRLEVAGVDTGQPDQVMDLDFQGSVNAGRLRLAGAARPLATPRSLDLEYEVQGLALAPYRPWLPLERLEGELAMLGQLTLIESAEQIRLQHNGRLQISALAVAGSEPGLVQIGSVEFDASTGLLLSDQDLELTLESVELGLAGLAAATPQIELDLQALGWTGRIALRRQADLQLQSTGKLQLTELGADLLQPAHRIRLQALAWDGQVDLDAARAELPELSGRLSLAGVSLRERNLDLGLLELQSLRAQDFVVHADTTVDVERLELSTLAALQMQGVPTVLRIGQLAADRINAGAAAGATIERMDLAALQIDLSRNQAGEFLVLRELQPAAAATPADGATDAAPSSAAAAAQAPAAGDADADSVAADAAPGLRIDRLSIGDGSSLRFQDGAVDPAFTLLLRIDELRVGALDTRRPEQPLQFELRAASGEHTEFTATGQARPFLADPAASIKGRISQFELQRLSAYTGKSLGYKLSSGLADSDFEFEIGAGVFEGVTRFEFVGLELNPSDEGQMEALTLRLSMPLPSALDLLRRDDGRIELEVPVDGRLNDPKFDISDAINQALGSAMKSGVFAYLTTMLQPYGTMITLAQMAGEAATRVRLEPVTYTPGTAQANIDLAAYLDRLVGLLRDKPDLTLRLCGFYTPADVEALRPPPPPPQPAAVPGATPAPSAPAASAPALPATGVTPSLSPEDKAEALANQRATDLKKRLVDEFGIAHGRLPLCLPEPDRDAAAVARVELLI